MNGLHQLLTKALKFRSHRTHRSYLSLEETLALIELCTNNHDNISDLHLQITQLENRVNALSADFDTFEAALTLGTYKSSIMKPLDKEEDANP